MFHRRPPILLAFAVSAIFAASRRDAVGQTPAPAEQPNVAGEIEYVGPDTSIRLDTPGRPQPGLGMTYEEFVAAWKKLEHVEANSAEPRFTIDELSITGQARDERAELDVELTIRSLASGPLKVPLGMADAILLEEPRLEVIGDAGPAAAARSFVGYEPPSGGFVAWLAGRPDQRHKLSMRIARPLLRGGNESSLQLNLPRALVSRLTLVVPTSIADAATAAGPLLTKEVTTDGGPRLL